MSDFTVQELTLGQLLENTAARFPDTDAVTASCGRRGPSFRRVWTIWPEA